MSRYSVVYTAALVLVLTSASRAQPAGRRLTASDRDSLFTAKLGYQPDADNEYALSYYRQEGAKYDPPYAGTYLRTNARQDGAGALLELALLGQGKHLLRRSECDHLARHAPVAPVQ